MRPDTLGAVLALLFSGRVFANQEIVRDIEVIEGDSFPFSVVTILHSNIVKCILEPPQDDIITFEPNNVDQSTDRFEVQLGNPMSQCQAIVNNLDKNDQGTWTMYYEHPDGTGESQRYFITVLPRDVLATEPSVFEGTNKLSTIEHFTRMDSLIDISLNKESFEEECYVVSPKRGMTKADTPLEGMRVQSGSEFVSCRITIGPMTDELIGQWGVCGKSKINEVIRCQPATIAWNNNNSNADWASRELPTFNHNVHFGGSVNPGVLGSGNAVTCHVITPNGEDLVLTSDVQYPNIERVHSGDTALCSVLINVTGPTSLGMWTVYGKFRAWHGLNEVRLPMNFTLYNEMDPSEQAYNITMLPTVNHVVNLNTMRHIEVTGSSVVNQCLFKAPGQEVFHDNSEGSDGVTLEKVVDGDKVACRIAVGPITSDMVGQWELIGKFNHGNLFDEKVQVFNIDIEDPDNPIQDIDRAIEDLPEQIINTSLEETHRLTIAPFSFATGESCHIVTPNGRQYTLMDGFNVEGVEIINETNVQCGVKINVTSEALVGEWVLISRGVRFSTIATEWRLPFTIHVEVEERAIPNQVNMAEGTDLYIRLEEPTVLFETCNLIGPDGSDVTHEIDALHINSCGYIAKNVSVDQTGKWTITFGNKIIHKAFIDVNVFAASAVSAEDQIWTLGTPVHTTIGPEDAVYCQLQDANGLTVFDSFGRCDIDIERVTVDHVGVWKMSVGMPGTVLLQETTFNVNVDEAVSTPVVTTSVVRVAPSVMLTCSVPAQYEVRGCKFRDHRGNIMLAHHGVGQDVEAGAVATSFESEVSASSCTLRLTNPTAADLGLWRCAVDTDQETLYAFMNVTCPWLMLNPDVAASVVLEPTLTQERTDIVSVEGDSTVMSCAIDASIRYCYFRARNGTIYNVRPNPTSQNSLSARTFNHNDLSANPSPTSDYEYVGAGFHAGECGIRFRNLLATDSGSWSCHVGLFDTTAPEQRLQFEVEVKEKMTVSFYRDAFGWTVLEGAVYNNHRVEYCRYIRIDGLGFTSDNVPPTFKARNELMDNGYCTLVMLESTILDLHPWTVVAKLAGVDQEIVRTSDNHLMEVGGSGNGGGSGHSNYSVIWLWVSFALIFLGVASIGMALIPQKNRRRAIIRVKEIRNSFRKVPLDTTQDTTPPSYTPPAV